MHLLADLHVVEELNPQRSTVPIYLSAVILICVPKLLINLREKGIRSLGWDGKYTYRNQLVVIYIESISNLSIYMTWERQLKDKFMLS